MEANCIRKVAVVLAVLSSFFNINSSAQVPAFPGADGYGRYTQGADQKSYTAMGQIPEFHQHTADDKVLRYAFNDFDELKVNGTTGDRESFLMLWPNMKRAADRIKKQVELLGNKEYPLTFDGSENSYDAGGNPDPYNANISDVAYRIMAELLAETGESDKADRLAGGEGRHHNLVQQLRLHTLRQRRLRQGWHVGRGDTRQQQIRGLRTGGGPRRQLRGGSGLVQAAMHRQRVARDRDSRGEDKRHAQRGAALLRLSP